METGLPLQQFGIEVVQLFWRLWQRAQVLTSCEELMNYLEIVVVHSASLILIICGYPPAYDRLPRLQPIRHYYLFLANRCIYLTLVEPGPQALVHHAASHVSL